MFYISSDIVIRSPLHFSEVAMIISCALEIPPFTKETFGRWEDSDVLVSKCFGLQFVLSETKKPAAPPDGNEYSLSIDSNFENPQDGMEKTIDATRYTLLLLRGCQDLTAIPS